MFSPSELRYIDAIGFKYRGKVPATDSFPYVNWWFKRWHGAGEASKDRYIAKWVVWC